MNVSIDRLMPDRASPLPLPPRVLSVTVVPPDGPTTLRQVSVPFEASPVQEGVAVRELLATVGPWRTAQYVSGILGPMTLTS